MLEFNLAGLFDIFGIFEMTSDVLFGIKVIALVMLYGYIHMNLGGGILTTVLFAVFGYFMLFYMQGMLSIIILVVFYLMLHAFDIIWGGDIARNIKQQKQMAKEAQMGQHMMPQGMMRPPPGYP